MKNNNCKIIAEIGWNHMGNVVLAKEMIDAAKECGADYVKFQTWSVKNLKSGPWDKDGRREIYEDAELTKEKHVELKKYCDDTGIEFLTSVFSAKDVRLICELGCKEIKIPSTECVNLNLVGLAISKFSHVYVSTGGLTEQEMKDVWRFLREQDVVDKVTLLHCVSLYPCPAEKANLNRIHYLRQHIDCGIGYSDHTQGVSAAMSAIAKEADVVEKHFTTDNNLPGRDNKFACIPSELKQICEFRDTYRLLVSDFRPCRCDEEDNIVEYRGRWAE